MASDLDKALPYKIISDTAVAARLKNGSNVRIYPIHLPQQVTLPAATFQQIMGTRIKQHGSPTVLPRQRIQITIYSTEFADVVEIDKLIKTAIDGKRGVWGVSPFETKVQACQAESEPRDEPIEERVNDKRLYGRSRDYFIMWLE